MSQRFPPPPIYPQDLTIKCLVSLLLMKKTDPRDIRYLA